MWSIVASRSFYLSIEVLRLTHPYLSILVCSTPNGCWTASRRRSLPAVICIRVRSVSRLEIVFSIHVRAFCIQLTFTWTQCSHGSRIFGIHHPLPPPPSPALPLQGIAIKNPLFYDYKDSNIELFQLLGLVFRYGLNLIYFSVGTKKILKEIARNRN